MTEDFPSIILPQSEVEDPRDPTSDDPDEEIDTPAPPDNTEYDDNLDDQLADCDVPLVLTNLLPVPPDLSVNVMRAYKLMVFAESQRLHLQGHHIHQPMLELESADDLPVDVCMEGNELITRVQAMDSFMEAGQ